MNDDLPDELDDKDIMNDDIPDELDENHFYILHVEDQDYDYEALVKQCLGAYGIPENNIKWTLAKNRVDALAALEAMSTRKPSGRGFDAILCDLAIPADKDEERKATGSAVTSKDAPPYPVDNGLAVAQAARGYDWLTAIIAITNWSKDNRVLGIKKDKYDGLGDSIDDAPIFDEFLGKEYLTSSGVVGEAKLKRWLIPTFNFVRRAKEWSPPVFFGRSLWPVLRGLLQIATADVAGKRLPRILLLGESGCGKGALAWTYYNLLRLKAAGFAASSRNTDHRDKFYVVNCASLVAEGEGGRVRLFGYRGPRSATLHSTPGVFEMASSYQRLTNAGFAFDGDEPDYSNGGVVFLDEFVETPLELQAAVLNTLEEGVVYRQDGSRVKIGCHVVFATNAPSQEIRDNIRTDLLDRIPYVLQVPPLRERTDEIDDLIKGFADYHLKQMHGGEGITKTFDVRITPSARQIIQRAVDLNLITSIRQLQAIATVRRGETRISDGNLWWILQKARLLGIPTATLTHSEEDLTLADKAKLLQLPGELQTNSLPLATEQAIHFLYKLYRDEWEDPKQAFPHSEEGTMAKRCLYLLLIFFKGRAPRMMRQNADAIRKARERLVEGLDIDTKNKAKVIAYLLNPTNPEAKP